MSYKPGDKVSVDHPDYPGIWTVKSQGPVNSLLLPTGGGRGLRVPTFLLKDPTDAASPRPTITLFDPGEFVRIPSGKFAGLYVVTRDTGKGNITLAKPGGDGGRYLRAGRNGLLRVPAAAVLK